MPPSLSLAFRPNPYTGATPRDLAISKIAKFVLIRGSVEGNQYTEPTNGELTALIGGMTITHHNLVIDLLAPRFEKMADLRAAARQIVVGGGILKGDTLEYGSDTLAEFGDEEVPAHETPDQKKDRQRRYDRPESQDEQAELLEAFRDAVRRAMALCSDCRGCKSGAYLEKE